MSGPLEIHRTTGTMSMFEFKSPDDNVPIMGLLSVDDRTNMSQLHIIDRNTKNVIFQISSASAINTFAGILQAAAETLEEVTIGDEIRPEGAGNSKP